MKKCRHNKSWIIGNYVEWCPVCGAIRSLKVFEGNTLTPCTVWCRPYKDTYESWHKRQVAWLKTRRMK